MMLNSRLGDYALNDPKQELVKVIRLLALDEEDLLCKLHDPRRAYSADTPALPSVWCDPKLMWPLFFSEVGTGDYDSTTEKA
jgi:hypothetical protein